MVRHLVSAVHVCTAGLLLFTGLWVLAQGRVNALWESGFYGTVSQVTLALNLAALLFVGAAALEALFAVGWSLRQSWGGYGLLAFSALNAAVFPAPLSWLFGAAMVAIGIELWASAPPRVDADAD